jgi:2,3-bisphosphoglycerate-independent phosphoglycerate mutase
MVATVAAGRYNGAMSEPHVLFLFLDGVGLGEADPSRNPFLSARLPALDGLLGGGWYLASRGSIRGRLASLAVTDACLQVPGRPQSATGQASLMTGRNMAAEIGAHYGPKPTQEIAATVRNGNLFSRVKEANGRAALLNPYPPRFFETIESGRRLLSVIPLAAQAAGLALRTHADLVAGQAVSPDFTGEGWRERLQLADTPVLAAEEAGERLARLGMTYTLALLEHWPTDLVGHRQGMDAAVAALERFDAVVAGVLDAWDHRRGMVVITSDHGNIEDLGVRSHTLNPVPTIVIGRDHRKLADSISDLTDVAPAVLRAISG